MRGACIGQEIAMRPPGFAGKSCAATRKTSTRCICSVSFNPRSPDALYNRALILQNLNRYGDALSCYEQALAIQPQFLDALINRGIVLHALKRHAEALASFDAALSLKPDDAE